MYVCVYECEGVCKCHDALVEGEGQRIALEVGSLLPSYFKAGSLLFLSHYSRLAAGSFPVILLSLP